MRWWEFQRVERQQQLLATMLDRLAIEPIQLIRFNRGNGLRDAADQCMRCFESDRCERWLANVPIAALPPDFCRNRETFHRLVSQRMLVPPLATKEESPNKK